jgi:hypothetical protein
MFGHGLRELGMVSVAQYVTDTSHRILESFAFLWFGKGGLEFYNFVWSLFVDRGPGDARNVKALLI